MIIEFILGVITITILAFVWENFKARNGPPGPLRFPLLGTLPQIALSSPISHIALDTLSKRYGDLMSIKLGGLETIVVSSSEAVKELFTREETLGRDVRGFWWDRNLRQNIGLSFANGEAWEVIRKYCAHTLKNFGYGNRHFMQDLLHEELQLTMENMEKESLSHPKHIVHIGSSYFQSCFGNLMCALVMGERYNYDDEEFKLIMKYNEDFVKNGTLGLGLLTAFPFLRFIIPDQLGYTSQLNAIYGTSRMATELLDSRRKESYNTNPLCFTDSFLTQIDNDSNKPAPLFTEDQFKVIFSDIMTGGSDTSSNYCKFLVLNLMCNPKVQEKLYNEIVQVCGLNRVPTLEDKPKMIYTQAVLLEGHRWARTLVHLVPKQITKDFEYRGYRFQKGTVLMTNLHSLFFDEKVWGDPDNFRPERFIDDSGKLVQEKVEKIIPFGLGRRNCFGETLAKDTIFILITTIIQKFLFQLPNDDKSKLPSLEPVVGVTISPHPFDAVVELRH